MVVSIYLNETIGGQFRELSNSIVFIFYGLGGVAANVISIWWNYFRVYACIQLALAGLASIGLCMLPKTPYFLYFRGQYRQMVAVLTRMASVNRVDDWSRSVRPKLEQEIQRIERIKQVRQESARLVLEISQE